MKQTQVILNFLILPMTSYDFVQVYLKFVAETPALFLYALALIKNDSYENIL